MRVRRASMVQVIKEDDVSSYQACRETRGGGSDHHMSKRSATLTIRQVPAASLADVLRDAMRGGRFVRVSYAGRHDGIVRERTVRAGVTRYLAGGPAAYDPADHGLIRVYDVTARGYRSIDAGRIRSVTSAGVRYMTPRSTPRAGRGTLMMEEGEIC